MIAEKQFKKNIVVVKIGRSQTHDVVTHLQMMKHLHHMSVLNLKKPNMHRRIIKLLLCASPSACKISLTLN
jgi:hypothetical protein